jgi:hypothetical protein
MTIGSSDFSMNAGAKSLERGLERRVRQRVRVFARREAVAQAQRRGAVDGGQENAEDDDG